MGVSCLLTKGISNRWNSQYINPVRGFKFTAPLITDLIVKISKEIKICLHCGIFKSSEACYTQCVV